MNYLYKYNNKKYNKCIYQYSQRSIKELLYKYTNNIKSAPISILYYNIVTISSRENINKENMNQLSININDDIINLYLSINTFEEAVNFYNYLNINKAYTNRVLNEQFIKIIDDKKDINYGRKLETPEHVLSLFLSNKYVINYCKNNN